MIDEDAAEAAVTKDGAARPPSPQGSTTHESSSTPDSNWHFATTAYIWFSGIHGTVGVRDFDASVHAGFGDVLSNFDIGFMAVSDYVISNSYCHLTYGERLAIGILGRKLWESEIYLD